MSVVGASRVGLGLVFGCKRVVKHMALSHALSIKNKSEHGFQSNDISVIISAIVDSSCISSSVMSSVRNLANGDDASTLVHVDGIIKSVYGDLGQGNPSSVASVWDVLMERIFRMSEFSEDQNFS